MENNEQQNNEQQNNEPDKKLEIKKVTVRALDDQSLEGVAGGGSFGSCSLDTTDTCYNCPIISVTADGCTGFGSGCNNL
jgi:hypothetical protein